MYWKHKAAVQNLIGRLPPNLGNPLYFCMQSTYGGLRAPTPVSRLEGGVEMVRRIFGSGHEVDLRTFVEVGTGHQLNLPLSLWLCGASQVTTVDLNPYLKPHLVMNDIAYVKNNQDRVRGLFAGLPSLWRFEDRFQRLLAISSFPELLQLTSICYVAPADASRLELAPASVDYHVSFTALEHIPMTVLKGILAEGRRLLKSDGLMAHYIDFTDHFAHSDSTISSVNFLQFSENDWEALAGNRYMFHNRLRVDEFRKLVLSLGLEILSLESRVDENALKVLDRGFDLNERFRNKDAITNATMDAWLLAAPR